MMTHRPVILVMTAQEHAAVRAALCVYIAKGMGDPARRPENIHEIAQGLDDEAPGEVISLDQDGLESFAKTIHKPADAADVLAALWPERGTSGVSAGCFLETGVVLALQAVERWSSGDLAGTINALEEWAGDVQAAFPGLDYDDDEADEDDDGEPLDMSGGDPGYALVKHGAPVILTRETATALERKASFATIADAVSYLGTSTTIDPADLHAGRYGIDAPHGMGSDAEALTHARRLGYDGADEAAALVFLSNIDPEA